MVDSKNVAVIKSRVKHRRGGGGGGFEIGFKSGRIEIIMDSTPLSNAVSDRRDPIRNFNPMCVRCVRRIMY